jgi:hypothetical protein
MPALSELSSNFLIILFKKNEIKPKNGVTIKDIAAKKISKLDIKNPDIYLLYRGIFE